MIHGAVSNRRNGAQSSSLIAGDLEQVERVLQRTLAPYRRRFPALIEHLQQYRGKRLRPALVLLIARACGRVEPAHHVLAAVLEMIHTATLVHDDVLDAASKRRHAQTVNEGWGNRTSILLGDLLFTTAFHLTSTIGDARACEWIGAATNRVCAGELLQTLERGNLRLTEDDYFEMIEGKTAALMECCGRLGAHYAGGDVELVERFAGFARDLGIAFQIADDVLDLAGSERVVGKTLGTDLAQRKLTLPLIYLLERSSPAQAVAYRRLLADKRSDFRELLDALRETGALEAARLRADALVERAKERLVDLPESAGKSALVDIASWAVRRS